MTLPVNPYIAGNPVGTTNAFVGRQDVLREVLRTLRQPHSNAILLFGQRRIGKTSVLQYLQAQLPEQGPYRPVYFDLQDKADWPLARVLGDLARTIAHGLDCPEPVEEWLNPETAFREEWLPAVLDALPPDFSLELLFDEFDVLADPEKEQASATFFPYLRGLLASDPARLQFVFVIGRNVDDLDTIALSLFKGTPYRRVSLLDQEDTVELVHLSQANGTLTWPDEAVKRVWQLTHGHPFLTQRLCSDVWERAYDQEPETPPTVSPTDVDAAVPDTLEASRNTLEWLWDGLGPAERVVTSALAEAGPGSITEEELGQLLRETGVRILIRELQNAPQLLQDWDILEPANGGYCFRVELLRRWVAEHKPLSRVQEDLERIEPVADSLFRAALGLYQGKDLEQAAPLLRQAIALNPNHVRANQLLADILLAQGNPEEARQQLERLYEYHPGAARPRLIQAILTQAQAATNEDEQLALYERVLELDHTQREAITGKRRVWEQRGDATLKGGDLDTALRAFQEAGLFEGRTEVQVLEQLYKRQPTVVRPRLIQARLEQAQTAESADERLEIYNRILELDAKQPEALTGKRRIWEQRGDDALTVDDLDGALGAYQTAGLSDKAAEVEKRLRRRELKAGLQNLETLEKKESYQEALALARELAGEFPDARKWNTDLKRLERKEELEGNYQRALDALKSGDAQTAQTLLAHVVALEAGYKQATRYLHLAVTGEDVTQLKEQLGLVPPETEETVEQELEEQPIIETAAEEELKALQEQPEAEQPSEPSPPSEEKTEPPSQRQLSPWNPMDHLRLLWWILVAPQQLQVHKSKRRTGTFLAATLIWLPLLIPALALNVGTLPRADTNASSLFNLLVGIALVFTWLLTSLVPDLANNPTVNAAVVAGFVVALGLMGRGADNAVLTLEFVVISAGILIVVGFVAFVIGGLLMDLSEGFGLITMVVGMLTALIIAPIVASAKVGGVKLGIGGVLLDIVAGIVAGTAVGIVAYRIEKSLKAGRSSWLVRGVFIALLSINVFLVWFSFLDGWRVFS